MQRWTALVFVALVAVAIAIVVARTGPAPRGSLGPRGATSAGSTALEGVPARPAPAASTGLASQRLDLDAGLDLDLHDLPGAEPDAGGQTLPNGQPAPNLPGGAPSTVSFGAVLVEYRGAEGSSPSARSKEDALVLAKQLASLAKTDFKAAVAQGDKGSGEDFGSIPRNVLEPGPEFVLFSLAVGEVSEPVDSPRGYYVLKRIE